MTTSKIKIRRTRKMIKNKIKRNRTPKAQLLLPEDLSNFSPSIKKMASKVINHQQKMKRLKTCTILMTMSRSIQRIKLKLRLNSKENSKRWRSSKMIWSRSTLRVVAVNSKEVSHQLKCPYRLSKLQGLELT